MCLTTTMMKPFVAKKDFVVCKNLKEIGDNIFVTPYLNCPIKLNSELKPNTKFPKTVEANSISLCANIGGGTIHAYIDNFSQYNIEGLFKAIVRKGTRFYISTNGTEIAAESLYITDEEITSDNPHTDEFKEAHEYIMSELRNAAEQHNGVRVGDIMLSDKKYSHVEEYKSNESNPAIGVVGYFIDEKPVAVGLKMQYLLWAYKSNRCANQVMHATDAYIDYKGRKYTNRLYELTFI